MATQIRVTLSSPDKESSPPIQVVVKADSHKEAQRRALEQHPTYVVEQSFRDETLRNPARILFKIVGVTSLVIGVLSVGFLIFKPEFKDYGKYGFLIGPGSALLLVVELSKAKIVKRL